MDSMVEENGNSSLDPLGDGTSIATSDGSAPQQTTSGTTILTTTANIVQFIPATNNQVLYNVRTKSFFLSNLKDVLVSNLQIFITLTNYP